jgi:hypothetical protein
MTTTTPPASGRTLEEFCTIAELGDDAKALVPSARGLAEFVRTLVERELFADAVRFLAYALPKREGIWWAWVCARHAAGAEPPPVIKAALDATERWITQPTEENRRLAMRAAEAAEFGTPAGCAALAVFLSGGSIAPPDAPPVAPGELMTAKTIAGSIILSAVSTDPAAAPDKFRTFVAQGLGVIDKLQLWKSA